jgi:hypothetical protein
MTNLPLDTSEGNSAKKANMVTFPLGSMIEHLSTPNKFLVLLSVKVGGSQTIAHCECVVGHIDLPDPKLFERLAGPIESHCLSLRRGTLHCDGELLPHEEVLRKDFRVTAHGCSRISVLLESDEAKDQRSLHPGQRVAGFDIARASRR